MSTRNLSGNGLYGWKQRHWYVRMIHWIRETHLNVLEWYHNNRVRVLTCFMWWLRIGVPLSVWRDVAQTTALVVSSAEHRRPLSVVHCIIHYTVQTLHRSRYCHAHYSPEISVFCSEIYSLRCDWWRWFVLRPKPWECINTKWGFVNQSVFVCLVFQFLGFSKCWYRDPLGMSSLFECQWHPLWRRAYSYVACRLCPLVWDICWNSKSY